jgi:hypothetical protein
VRPRSRTQLMAAAPAPTPPPPTSGRLAQRQGSPNGDEELVCKLKFYYYDYYFMILTLVFFWPKFQT